MKVTKKVKSTGRFGARYGVGIKKRVLKVEEKQNAQKNCPFCGFDRIKREAAGLFKCTKCDAKFTGGAYESETLVGKTIKKMVNQKTFIESSVELIKATEEETENVKEKRTKKVPKRIKEKVTSYSDIEKAVKESE